MKQLAIRGDKQRGAEVIALLESLGGHNISRWDGRSEDMYYYLTLRNTIDFNDLPCDDEDAKLYTLDEFWKDFPYKVGDNVMIGFLNAKAEVKRMWWNEDKERIEYECELIGSGERTTAIAEDLIPIEADAEEEPINIAKILKDAPTGTKLYSPIFGEVHFSTLSEAEDYINYHLKFKPYRKIVKEIY